MEKVDVYFIEFECTLTLNLYYNMINYLDVIFFILNPQQDCFNSKCVYFNELRCLPII